MKSDTGPFALVPEWVLNLPISDRAIRLYAVLGRYADESGACWPSRRTLAGRLNCSDDSVDRAKRELIDAGALEMRHQLGDDGALTTNRYLLIRAAPLRLGGVTAAAGGPRGAAAENENHLEREPLGDTAAHGGPDERIQKLVAGYVDDYAYERSGHHPSVRWRGAAGKAAKTALEDGEDVEDIARCFGVIAHEGKNPSALPHVLSDMHANRPRRMQ